MEDNDLLSILINGFYEQCVWPNYYEDGDETIEIDNLKKILVENNIDVEFYKNDMFKLTNRYKIKTGNLTDKLLIDIGTYMINRYRDEPSRVDNILSTLNSTLRKNNLNLRFLLSEYPDIEIAYIKKEKL